MNNLIMKCLTGSRAYGTSTPTSDTDIRGIFCAERKAICTPWYTVNEVTLPEEEDGKVYEFTNFMKLFVDQNPNILELAFVAKSDIIETSPAYDRLRKIAPELLSSKVAHTFSGYAMAQLKRIKGHNKWINNPQPDALPTQKDFMRLVYNLTDHKVLKHEGFISELGKLDNSCILFPYGNDVYAVIESQGDAKMFNSDGTIHKVDYESLPDEVKKQKPIMVVKYLSEDHRMAKEKYKNYWTWKAERNETRHQLEVDFGFDTKHAMHLVRLMRMCEEILTEGTLVVKRPDAKELLEIRNGAWSYDKLLGWAEEKDNYIHEVLYPKTSLPRVANINKASEFVMEIQDLYW